MKYLNEVRAGTRRLIPGISEADVLAEIERQQTLLKSLDILTCPKTPA